jgi:uncharacterized protein
VRLVLDTNVLVSAAISRGTSRELLDLWLRERPFALVVCPALLDELAEVLNRERFRAVVTAEEVEAIITLLRHEAELVPDPDEIAPVASDPDDDYLIAVARREDADALVSGDRALRAIEGLELLVLTPAEALSRLSGSD